MRRGYAAILALGLFASQVRAAPVAAPSGTIVHAPNWISGSEWYYSDGYGLKVTSVTPHATVFDRIDAPGQWFSREGFIRKDSTSATATRTAIYRTLSDKDGFALTVGAPLTFQREYLSNGVLMVHASSWTVEGRETITVPAGTFDCWLIVWRTRSLKSDWTGFERWWYSPVAQNYVRLEYKYGPGAEGSRVLMRYSINGAAAVPVAQAPAAPPTPLVSAIETPPPPPMRAAPNGPIVVAARPPVVTVDAPGPVHLDPKPLLGTEAAKPAPAASAAAESAPQSEFSPLASGARQPAEPAPVPKSSPAKQAVLPAGLPASTAGTWHAQIGSSKDQAAMRISLKKTLDANPQLTRLPSGITAHAVAGRGIFFRAWVGEFDKQGDAKAVCDTITGKGPGCSVFKAQTRGA